MKKILLVATGGTIASRNMGSGLAPAIDVKELLAQVPEIESRCHVDAVQPFSLDSTNLYAKHWLEIARIVREQYDSYDGFVVTHGTDTLAYTAAALGYLVQNSPKPIVLTGSQRSVYLRDTDARRNLADAFAYAADDGACGVNVVFDGRVILGTRARKTRTRSYNAFSSIDFPELAIIRDGEPFYYIHEPKPERAVFYEKMDDRVFVLKMTPGIRPDIFGYLAKTYEAVILESFGSGGLPHYENDDFFRSLRAFLDAGKTVVVTTQVEREGSALDRYEVGRRLLECGDVLEARTMTLEAAFTKLSWLLANFPPEERSARFYAPVRKDIL